MSAGLRKEHFRKDFVVQMGAPKVFYGNWFNQGDFGLSFLKFVRQNEPPDSFALVRWGHPEHEQYHLLYSRGWKRDTVDAVDR
jgi:hypothetical protein